MRMIRAFCWLSEDKLWELILAFYLVAHGDRTQAIRPDRQCLYLLQHLAGPIIMPYRVNFDQIAHWYLHKLAIHLNYLNQKNLFKAVWNSLVMICFQNSYLEESANYIVFQKTVLRFVLFTKAFQDFNKRLL